MSLARRWRAPSLPRDGPPNAAVIDRTSAVPLAARDLTLHQFPMRLEEAAMTGCGPRLPSWAFARDGSYPGISGRPARASMTRSACAEAQHQKHHFDAERAPDG